MLDLLNTPFLLIIFSTETKIVQSLRTLFHCWVRKAFLDSFIMFYARVETAFFGLYHRRLKCSGFRPAVFVQQCSLLYHQYYRMLMSCVDWLLQFLSAYRQRQTGKNRWLSDMFVYLSHKTNFASFFNCMPCQWSRLILMKRWRVTLLDRFIAVFYGIKLQKKSLQCHENSLNQVEKVWLCLHILPNNKGDLWKCKRKKWKFTCPL